MKSRTAFFAGMCTLLLCLPSLAHAKTVGTLTCTASTGQVKFNVSFFTFGLVQTLNIGSQSSGAGAGKATFQPLEVHAALSTFSSLVEAAGAGTAFENCILTTSFNDGSTTEFEFKLVAIKQLTVVASMQAQTNEPAHYTDMQFEFGAVQVKNANGSDDGGTGTLPPGWDITTNQPS
jgi:hypothetical protein